MLSFSLVACVLASSFALVSSYVISRNSSRIYGGEPADISEVPYQISLRYYGKHRCGGSIISDKFVVTAAHCVACTYKENLKVIAGVTKKYEPGTEFDVEQYHPHEGYNSCSASFDIGVIKVKGIIEFTNKIKSIRLPKSGLVIPDNTLLLISGWGEIENGAHPAHLHKVLLKIMNKGECKRIWKENGVTIRRDVICAHDKDKSACYGDSGGPLVLGKGNEAVLIGATSFGPPNCVDPVIPNGYANVIELKEWILSKTNIGDDN